MDIKNNHSQNPHACAGVGCDTDGWSGLFNYSRREAHEVNVGDTPLGGDNPIRVQSMTTTPTADTEACVIRQNVSLRLAENTCVSPLRE